MPKSSSPSRTKKESKTKTAKLDRQCFVIMPFSPTPSCSDWDNVYKNFIGPAVTGAGRRYQCMRSEIRGGAFIRDIMLQLNTAHVVLADLTDMNPNVFYELGVRHVLKSRTILVAQDLKHVPSDLRAYGVIIYSPTVAGLRSFKTEIRKMLRAIDDDPNRPDSPVDDYLKNRAYILSDASRDASIRQLMSLHAELYDNLAIAGINMDESKNLKWTMSAHPSVCLEHAITTQYVNFDHSVFTAMKLLHLKLGQLSRIALEDSLVTPTRQKLIRENYVGRLDVLQKHIATILTCSHRSHRKTLTRGFPARTSTTGWAFCRLGTVSEGTWRDQWDTRQDREGPKNYQEALSGIRQCGQEAYQQEEGQDRLTTASRATRYSAQDALYLAPHAGR